ncbi:PREDICTED: uncharacterized protein LOC105968242 [Erythranthe guttata]|uniref:uncharacterized protein LOC105968242 n=1 Tax=Erythranthe guttata TaxID=4155 RepID=UPI00064DB009|nr:PREDICTED: uncharacterized protein LOC105968242 [Erythranthe guttata]|eukprot:XP_012848325.1 PREDICTED: uncharacterized protein LOC105968242 [Erythranthe guttata]
MGRNELGISHLFYADDVLIFTNGHPQSVTSLKEIINKYERSSRQKTNMTKSGLYLGKGATAFKVQVEGILGIKTKDFPIIYLGVPVSVGRNKAVDYEFLVSKIRMKLEGWKTRLLSFGGKITLIKSVLASVPVYTLACSYVPKSVLNRIEQLMAMFLWSSRGAARFHWVKWGKICKPVEEGLDRLEELLQYIPPSLQKGVQHVVLRPDKDDELICTVSSSGEFYAKDYWELLAVTGGRHQWAERLWQPYIPFNSSAFLWKGSHHALPVDDRIIQKGIPIASKCNCCLVPRSESIQHLLLSSDCATKVWSHFSHIFHTPWNKNSIVLSLLLWSYQTKDYNSFAAIKLSTCVLIMHGIWKARCSARFDEEIINPLSIIRRIMHQLGLVAMQLKPKKKNSPLQDNILQSLRLPSAPVREPVRRWFRWEKPPLGLYKLNVDGSSKEGLCAGGGIIRDGHGRLVAAFSSFYGHGSNNKGELSALLDGLQVCQALRLSNVIIESDSVIVVNAIQGRSSISWDLTYMLRQCSEMLPSGYSITHIVRQKNVVADRLAAWAYNHMGYQDFFQTRDLPSSVWGMFRCNQLGLWELRK